MFRKFFDWFKNWGYNLGQNICRLFHFLAQFIFTTSEIKLDYYHQKVNVQIASRVAKQLGIIAGGRAIMPTQEKKKI